MIQETVNQRTLCLLAEILDYPISSPTEKVKECIALVSADNGDAAARLQRFQALAEETSMTRLEEIYTTTFDLDAACHPYVGYHLFGESYKRSVFLVELKERYRQFGFVFSDTELPDRLSVLLKFLSLSMEEESRQEIIAEGLLPALEKMSKEPKEGDRESQGEGDAYRNVLQALRLILKCISAPYRERQGVES